MANATPVRSSFNWRILDGDPDRQVTYSIQADTSDPIPQVKMLDPDGCVVLESDGQQGSCVQSLTINPCFQVVRLALIAECSLIELDIGRPQEYYQTYHGTLIFEADDSKVYRFDMEFGNLVGTIQLTMRFILPQADKLCLYGMHLQMERNTNPMDLFTGDTLLNRAMLKCKLDDDKLSERAVKCKTFLTASMGGRLAEKSQNIVNNNVLQDLAQDENNVRCDDPSIGRKKGIPPNTVFPPDVLIKSYIDEKIQELESRISAQLEAIEARQTEKLDKILILLGSNHK